MTENLKPRYASCYRDRHGKPRWRFRKGDVSLSLPGQPGTREFEEAYENAANGYATTTSAWKLDLRREALLQHYCQSAVNRARKRASRQQVPFDLSVADIEALVRDQSWRCAISGIPFAAENVSHQRQKHAFRPSVDRVIPARGYVLGNVRIVCEIVNLAMNDWGEEPLLHLVSAMAQNRVANLSG